MLPKYYTFVLCNLQMTPELDGSRGPQAGNGCPVEKTHIPDWDSGKNQPPSAPRPLNSLASSLPLPLLSLLLSLPNPLLLPQSLPLEQRT